MKLIMLIFLGLFFWFLIGLISKFFRVVSFLRAGFQNPFEASHSHSRRRTEQQQAGTTTMVKCAACDLYVLDSEAISRNGMHFCSPEHARNSN